jgi:hypothetical protein
MKYTFRYYSYQLLFVADRFWLQVCSIALGPERVLGTHPTSKGMIASHIRSTQLTLLDST